MSKNEWDKLKFNKNKIYTVKLRQKGNPSINLIGLMKLGNKLYCVNNSEYSYKRVISIKEFV